MTEEPPADGGRLRSLQHELVATSARLRAEIAAVISASSDSNADDEHDPEGATIAFERAQLQAVLDQTEQRVREVEAALARVTEGTYGRCEVCGLDIAPERIAARPMARRCLACASTGR